MNDQTPPEPFTNQTLGEFITALWNKFLPRDAKWRRITVALLTVYSVVVLPTYFLGLSSLIARKIVYYVWRTSIFGMFSDTIPYSCGRPERCDFVEIFFHEAPGSISAHISVVFLVIGGAISLRLALLCFEVLERGLGVDFMSRLIDKFLPGPRSASGDTKKE